MSLADTIAAISTPPGYGGIGIVRLSGSLVTRAAGEILRRIPPPRRAEYLPFHRGASILDRGIALYFPAPHSFTGEDVLELHAHGGPVLLNLLLDHVLSLPGLRLALPGEFSERALLNGKIDLCQAEAISALIRADSEQMVLSAASTMDGALSCRLRRLHEQVVDLRVAVEAGIDFAEAETSSPAPSWVEERMLRLLAGLEDLADLCRQGGTTPTDPRLVIAGQPNVGKSSLLNALAEAQTSIVSGIAGTTRDLIRERIYLGGLPIQVVDTAGLRSSDDGDEVEKIGMRLARGEISRADHLLWVFDRGDEPDLRALPAGSHPENTTIVRNKIDLLGRTTGLEWCGGYLVVNLSAKLGGGIDLLRRQLRGRLGSPRIEGGGACLVHRRYLHTVERLIDRLRSSQSRLAEVEIVAEELGGVQRALEELGGPEMTRELLGEIFSRFCVGK